MASVVVASTKKHAEVIIKWMNLGYGWEALAYGDKVLKTYVNCKLVRPVSGIEQDDYDWVLQHLIPSIRAEGTMVTVPPSWRLPEPDEFTDAA